MKINETTNQNFGLKMSYNLQSEYSKIFGVKYTKKLMGKIANIGSKNTFYSDFDQISLLPKYNVFTTIYKSPILLSGREIMSIEIKLFKKALRKAAKDGNLINVAKCLKSDYNSFEKIINNIFLNPKLQEIDSKVDTYRMHHPLLYKFGFRPNTNI